VLAYAGMIEGKEVTWFPSYGAEIRGGTANCTVVLSDELIGSPIVTSPDILITMSSASLKKFLPRLRQKGLLLFDSSLITESLDRTDIESIGVPATDISSRIGNTKSSNMVLLGALIGHTGLMHEAAVFAAIKSSITGNRKKGFNGNDKAVIEGIKFIEDKKS
jgi:2-oxoglutarate ferredoxin oxidoreductase subunit gamma